MADRPNISCVMLATPKRAALARTAIERWRRDYGEGGVELVVVFGPGEAFDLPDVPGLVTVMARDARVPTKYESGFVCASGCVVAKIDDDDWYSPDRLARQAAPILAGAADIVSLREDLAVRLPDCSWWRSRHHHAHNYLDATTAVRRELVGAARWPQRTPGETSGWVDVLVRQGSRHLVLEAGRDFVYGRHSRNTWRLNERAWAQVFETVEAPDWFPPGDLNAMAAAAAAVEG